MAEEIKVHDVIMVGAGPAALSAAIYTTREDIETLLLEKSVVGGLAAITDWIDNYPGFPDGLSGIQLADNLQKQAERFGTKFDYAEVQKIREDGKIKVLETTNGELRTRAVLISTGSDYKRLGIPGEDEYYARGVHFCATCDGAFYRDKHLVVVGGGNSAVQETIFLTKFASKIDLLVRGPEFRASDVLQHELEKHKDKVTVHFNTQIEEIIGEEQEGHKRVTKVLAKDAVSNEKKEYTTDGVFVFIGLKPNTQFAAASGIDLDEIGFIKTDDCLRTNIPGVFAAGDVRSGATMQIASAAGEGATAALRLREYLESPTTS